MNARRLIALVDDNARVRGTYQFLLRARGFDCVSFASAEGFLQSKRRHEADCLLLDVWMPGMSGLELQRQLAADNLRIPIIILTGDPDETIEALAREAGAVRFLAKNTPPEDLIAALSDVLGAGAA
ncbi:MAG TPA: response regulator [Candidatus Didemnitutus sp.]|nr:response regulator [Candidatus Didemnitutus sp.]